MYIIESMNIEKDIYDKTQGNRIVIGADTIVAKNEKKVYIYYILIIHSFSYLQQS